MFVFVRVADFEAKYLEFDILGEGGFGSVYAGNRKKDNLPVSNAYSFTHTHTVTLPCTRLSTCDAVL